MTRGQLNTLISYVANFKNTKNLQINTLQNQIISLQELLTEKEGIINGYVDKWNDADLIQLRLDELGRVQQTTEGTGSAFDPYKYWTSGTEVHIGEWWQTEDGYIWEAKKDGVPTSSTDAEYWDMPE